MGTVSIDSLWHFIQDLSLSANDRLWLASKLVEQTPEKKEKTGKPSNGRYIISPRMQKLMGSVHIAPKDIEQDEKAKYILEK